MNTLNRLFHFNGKAFFASERFYYVLKFCTLFAAILMIISIANARLAFSYLGALSSFPIYFYISLFISVLLAIISAKQHIVLAWVNIFIIVFALWLVPSIIGISTGHETHAYSIYGLINLIIKDKHIDTSQIFLNWPGWALEGTFLTKIIGSNISHWIIAFTPFFIQSISIMGIIIISQSKISEKIDKRIWIICALLFTLTDWTHVSSFIPQGYTFALAIMLISFCGRYWDEVLIPAGPSIVILLLTFGIITGHWLTSIGILGVLLVFAIRKRKVWWISIMILALIFELFWIVYSCRSFMQSNLPTYANALLNFISSIFKAIEQQTSPVNASGSYGMISSLRLYVSLFTLILGVVGFIYWFISRQRKPIGSYMTCITIGLLSLLVAIAGGITNVYIIRTYSLLLLPVLFFAAFLSKFKVVLFAMVILIALMLPGSLIIREGFQQWESEGTSYLTGLETFHAHADEGAVAELKSKYYGDNYPFGFYDNMDTFFLIPQVDATIPVIKQIVKSVTPNTIYFVSSELGENVYKYVLGDQNAYQTAEDYLNENASVRLYDNGSVKIWIY